MKWEKVKLGEIAEFKNGLNFSKDQYGAGVKYISVADFKDYFSARIDTLGELKEDFISPNYFLEEGDILFVRSNGNKELVGRSLFIEKIDDPITFSGFCIRARLTNDNLIPRFYAYLFNSSFFRQTLSVNAGGTNINNLNQRILSNLIIPIPPLPTQRRIAAILSAYDDLIENNLRRIKLLEEEAFLRYREIVTNEELKEFTIEEVANVIMGQSPKSNTYTDDKSNIPFHQGVTNFDNYFVKDKTYCTDPKKIAPAGSILFSVRAPVGRINFTNKKVCIGRGICSFNSKKGFQNFLFYQLKDFFFQDDVIGNGSIFNSVTKKELMNVALKTPSDVVQEEFEKGAKPVYNLILNLSHQNTKLREARDILLPRLMNGTIKV